MRVSTVPNAMETAPARPAATPTGSSAAFGVNTNSATPAVPQIAPRTAINRALLQIVGGDKLIIPFC